MRKTKLLTVLGLLSVSLVALFSCKNNVNKIVLSEERVITSDTKEVVDRDQLVFLSLTDNYKLTEDEVYHDLTSFLQAKDGTLPKNTEDSNLVMSKNIIDDSEFKYDIVKTASFSKSFLKNKSDFKVKGVENIQDEVSFSIYNLTDKESGTPSFAIMSDDERVGSILCVIEGEYDENMKNPLLDIFTSALDDYVEEVSNEWESITERDYELFKEKYGITDEEIQKAKEEYESGLRPKQFWGYGSWSNWAINDINLNNWIFKTKWGQGNPYNYAIRSVYGKNYYVGCGAVAVAQIMAYHKFPKNYGLNLDYLKDKWSVAKDYNWNGVYDWEAMTSNPNANYISTTGEIGVCALMYEVFEGCKSKPVEDEGTSTTMDDRINFLRKIGYKCDNEKNYSYSNVSKSLHSNCPVMVRGEASGTGHAWVIDGSIELKRSRNYYVFWIPFSNDEYQSYVHCNYGWSGRDDQGVAYSFVGTGYYKSGVFSTSNGDFSKSLRIATNIRPK